jgi:hypothetical protein
MRDVVAQLETLAAGDTDLRGHVWAFDTLKRMTDVINKGSLKHLLGLMRKLSSRGMTCILLGHTNKYRDDTGAYVYEGTGDLESDCDELIYFEPRANDDRSLTVSTRCTKRRANIGEFTWDIDADRTVTKRDGYIDIAAEAAQLKQRAEDETLIAVVTAFLSSGARQQHEIIAHCAQYHFGNKRVHRALKRWRGSLWLEKKLGTNNAIEYVAVPNPPPPPAEPT